MASKGIIRTVQRRMELLRITQPELASACRLTQPHISKVLNGKIKLTKKTETRLQFWLETTNRNTNNRTSTAVREMAARIERTHPDRQIQIMKLLAAVAELLED